MTTAKELMIELAQFDDNAHVELGALYQEGVIVKIGLFVRTEEDIPPVVILDQDVTDD